MYIQLTEPVAPRYIHIASETNTVHVLVPTEPPAFNVFFNSGAVRELEEYKRALAFDIVVLEESIRRRTTLLTPQPSAPFPFDERDIRRTTKKAQLTLIETLLLKEENLLAAKKGRLKQIERYIQEIITMKARYSDDDLTSALREIHPFSPVRYVSNQHATCVTFAEFIPPLAAPTPEHPDYFQSVREDFTCSPDSIPEGNEQLCRDNGINAEVEQLLELSDERLDKLLEFPENKEACRAHPAFMVRRFLDVVAKATPDKTDKTLIKTEAEALLKDATPEERQALLRASGVFTDYSGRTFNCTAFEYAYWAKDIHMCRMLMSHMDDETKAELLARIKVIEGIDTDPGEPVGLSYQQAGIEYRSAHFDLTPLIAALQHYVDGFNAWYAAHNMTAIKTAWLAVGKEQRELPVHVFNEYCRKDRSFNPTPRFNDGALPRALQFHNFITDANGVLFPHGASNSGLGFNFALLRIHSQQAIAAAPGWAGCTSGGYRADVRVDLIAVKRLDEVRTVALTRLREDLNPPASTQSSCMVM